MSKHTLVTEGHQDQLTTATILAASWIAGLL
jgi:hypothetical protein